jgi:hypothetical protein
MARTLASATTAASTATVAQSAACIPTVARNFGASGRLLGLASGAFGISDLLHSLYEKLYTILGPVISQDRDAIGGASRAAGPSGRGAGRRRLSTIMRVAEAEEHLLAAGVVRQEQTACDSDSDSDSDGEPSFVSRAPVGARCCDDILFGGETVDAPPDTGWQRAESHSCARQARRALVQLIQLLLLLLWAICALCAVGPDEETHRLRRALLPAWAGGGVGAARGAAPHHVVAGFWAGVAVLVPWLLLRLAGALGARSIRSSRARQATSRLGESPEDDGQSAVVTLRDGRQLGYCIATPPPNGEPLARNTETGVPRKVAFFFHGFPGCRSLMHAFPALVETLEGEGVSVVGVDRPGFGLSSFQPRRTVADFAKDIVQLADALSVQRFAVIGHSAGAPCE